MTWALAAAHGPRPAAARNLDAVLTRFGGAVGGTLELPRLAAAATGTATPAPGRSACALAGTIYDASRSAHAAGVDPSLPAPELLARAHAVIGDRVLEGLRGDFVLLMADLVSGEGFVARDQMGGMPAYWASGPGAHLFTTDPAVLLALLASRPAPDTGALATWLAVDGVPAQDTLYRGVKRIEAGCLVRLGRGTPTTERYWQPTWRRPGPGSRFEHAERLRTCLETATDRRCGDAASGILLSGGLDSSTVAAIASQRGRPARRPSTAYSAVFPAHPSIDESELIDRLCRRFALRSVRAVVGAGSVLGGSLGYLERFAIPPVSPNLFFWEPLLDRAAAEGVTAMLDGEGGDEVFGLSPMLLADHLRHGRLLSIRRLIHTMPGASRGVTRAATRRMLADFAVRGAAPAWLQRAVRRARGGDRYAPSYLRPAARAAYLDALDGISWKSRPGPRWFTFLADVVTRSAGPAFLYEHVALRARTAGIEPRHPLVDVDVVEAALSTPPELAYDSERSRPLLRATTAGLLPDAVRLRPSKSTFDALFHQALDGPDRPLVTSLLGPQARIGEFVDLGAVRGELVEAPAPRGGWERMSWAIRVWRLATAELWLAQQEDLGAPRALIDASPPRPAAAVEVLARLPA